LGVPHIFGLKIVGGTVFPPPVDRKVFYRAPQSGDAAGRGFRGNAEAPSAH
jgi:hypothetical protein